MSYTLAVANQKGGVGKTTTVLSLGTALSEAGRRVLLVDLDPQANLSLGLGVDVADDAPTVYHALCDSGAPPGEAVRPTEFPGLSLIPANIDLSAAEIQLFSELNRERALERALAPLSAGFDYVLVDCPPSLGLLTINALAAADGVLVPLQCAYWAMRGMKQLLDTIDRIRTRGVNPDLELAGVLLTMFDGRTTASHQVAERVREAFPDRVFKTLVKSTVQFNYASVAHQPILAHAPSSDAAQAYRQLAREIEERMETRQEVTPHAR